MTEILQKAIRTGIADEEEHLLYAVIMEPSELTDEFVTDLEGHIIPKEVIKESAHTYLRDYRYVSIDHEKPVYSFPVQSFIAPCDFKYDDSDEAVYKDSWVVIFEIPDNELWEYAKAGGIKGVSPGGLILEYEVLHD